MSPRSSDSADVKVAVCNMRMQVVTWEDPSRASTVEISCMQHACQPEPNEAGRF